MSKTGVSDEFTTEGYAVVNHHWGLFAHNWHLFFAVQNPQLTPVLLTPGT